MEALIGNEVDITLNTYKFYYSYNNTNHLRSMEGQRYHTLN